MPGGSNFDEHILKALGRVKSDAYTELPKESEVGMDRRVFGSNEQSLQAPYDEVVRTYDKLSPIWLPWNQSAYLRASQNYKDASANPDLPRNRMYDRWQNEYDQGQSDADIILQAMTERELAGRK